MEVSWTVIQPQTQREGRILSPEFNVQGSDGIEVFVTTKFFNLALVDRSSAIFDVDQLTYDQSIAFLDKPAEDWVGKEVLGIKSTRDFVFDGSYAG